MPESKLESKGENKIFLYIKSLETRLQQLEKNYADKVRLIEQSAQPSLTVNGQIVLWRDTDDNKQYLITRANDTDKKVELT